MASAFPWVVTEGLLKVAQMIVLLQALYQHVVYVNLHIPPNLMCEHFVHQSLICGTYVLEPKWHHILAEEILASNK